MGCRGCIQLGVQADRLDARCFAQCVQAIQHLERNVLGICLTDSVNLR
jgi:hypothetical protein